MMLLLIRIYEWQSAVYEGGTGTRASPVNAGAMNRQVMVC